LVTPSYAIANKLHFDVTKETLAYEMRYPRRSKCYRMLSQWTEPSLCRDPDDCQAGQPVDPPELKALLQVSITTFN